MIWVLTRLGQCFKMTGMSQTPAYYTVGEAASIMDVSRWTIHYRIKTGTLTGVTRTASGQYLIPRESVPA